MNLPIVNVDDYLKGKDISSLSKIASDSLCLYGIVILRDTRVTIKDHEPFLNMMEEYFEQCDFQKDARPEYSYQVGVTPERQEQSKNHCTQVQTFDLNNRPVTLCPPKLDLKCRFFWRIGSRPEKTSFQELNASPVLPLHFPKWEPIMNTWGSKMMDALKACVEMVAIGLELEKDTFSKLMINGPHLLAPTGSNFNIHQKEKDVLAAYHYDLNLLTIHGKSRFPGLFIWLRDGTRVAVKIPDGCLLVQAGKQMEYLTGGAIEAGFHEVIISNDTLKTIELKTEKKESLWRVSSTLFSHTASDMLLQPLGKYATAESCAKYPPILAGDQVRLELAHLNLGKSP